jgi:hypothetical protein
MLGVLRGYKVIYGVTYTQYKSAWEKGSKILEHQENKTLSTLKAAKIRRIWFSWFSKNLSPNQL